MYVFLHGAQQQRLAAAERKAHAAKEAREAEVAKQQKAARRAEFAEKERQRAREAAAATTTAAASRKELTRGDKPQNDDSWDVLHPVSGLIKTRSGRYLSREETTGSQSKESTR